MIGSLVMMLSMTRISWKCLKTTQMIFLTLSRIFLMMVGLVLTELCELEKGGLMVVSVVKSKVFVMVKLGGRSVEY